MRLRVILLEKIASMDKDCFTRCAMEHQGRQGPWITLGHFDAMYTYQLDANSRHIFQAVSDNNQKITACNSGERYYHPLYVLTDKEESDSAFWKMDAWCMAVSRIHYEPNTDIRSLHTALMELLPKDAAANGCACHVYYTMELSDLVVAVKSDRMSNILNFALRLRKYSCVGKVYTYCGIDYGHVKDTIRFPDMDDVIPTVSMRFSVLDFQQLDDQMNDVRQALAVKTPYFAVAGVDDILLTCEDLPMSKLVRLYRSWFIPDYAASVPLKKVFSEVTTRVGITLAENLPYVQVGRADKDANRKKLTAACQQLMEIDGKIQEYALNPASGIHYQTVHSWLKPLSELTKSLLRMSRTSVLDEFVYLMLPGVTTFLKCILRHFERCAAQPDPWEMWAFDNMAEYFQRFVENWSHLMEHVMRAEGQLAHHPETRPMIYDIPVVMLEYTMAFLNQVSEVLLSGDARKERISFLLVPYPRGEINALELFEAQGEAAGLVLVTIPFHMLYDPVKVLSALAHEISHYVGESFRRRLPRTDYFAKAAAALLAKLVFASYDPWLIEEIVKLFKGLFAEEHINNRAREMQITINGWSHDFFTQESYSKFVRAVLLAKDRQGGDLQFESDLAKLKEVHMPEFRKLLETLCTLFREVYADICMLYLLPLKTETHIRNLLEGLAGGSPADYEAFAARIYVALTVLGRQDQIPQYLKDVDQANWQQLRGEIEKVSTGMKQSDEGTDRLLPLSSIRFLLQYARECADSLRTALDGSADVGEIQRMFNAIADGLDYDTLLDAINEYRKRVINP